MFCANCGREIPDGSTYCPYCGRTTGSGNRDNAPSQSNRSVGYSVSYDRKMKKTNGWGVTGFIFALIGLFAGAFYGIVPFIAFICSIVGTALRHRRYTCNALAVWGLVLSILSLIGWIIFWAITGGLLSML